MIAYSPKKARAEALPAPFTAIDFDGCSIQGMVHGRGHGINQLFRKAQRKSKSPNSMKRQGALEQVYNPPYANKLDSNARNRLGFTGLLRIGSAWTLIIFRVSALWSAVISAAGMLRLNLWRIE